jgi:hypothetical protein
MITDLCLIQLWILENLILTTSCEKVTVVRKQKVVCLKQLSTVNSVRNICYASRSYKTVYTLIDRINTQIIVSDNIFFHYSMFYTYRS